jgi:hypothetical protein
MFDVIERLKTEWTDKYVVVDSPAPELARFAQATGFVKTVNMNGRCLVEFDQFNNIGWYDIDPSALKIVPQPLPKPAEPKEKAAKPAAKEAAKPAAKPAAGAAKKPSTADILAAARAKGGAAPAAKEPAAKPAAGGGKLSTAEILARARGAKAAAAPAAPVEEPAAEVAPQEQEEAPAPAPVKKAAKAAAGAKPTTTAEKIAWCRQHDAQG